MGLFKTFERGQENAQDPLNANFNMIQNEDMEISGTKNFTEGLQVKGLDVATKEILKWKELELLNGTTGYVLACRVNNIVFVYGKVRPNRDRGKWLQVCVIPPEFLTNYTFSTAGAANADDTGYPEQNAGVIQFNKNGTMYLASWANKSIHLDFNTSYPVI